MVDFKTDSYIIRVSSTGETPHTQTTQTKVLISTQTIDFQNH